MMDKTIKAAESFETAGRFKAVERFKATGQRAFTLLEIMVALAIVGVAMVALLSLGNRSIGVHDRLQHLTQATLLAQQKMAESELEARRGGVAQLANSAGAFSDPFTEYQWRIEISNTPLPAVQMVTVTVLWGDEERNEGVDVTSFLF
ncbi:MAG: type II secretion system protein GspI [Deltaproteobacteria bacterium]|nr:MAG: type II secretion system protein GspI [Deltaproteobacteria bacterium]